MECPKCGFEQEPSNECVRCGIIFQKYINKRFINCEKPPPPQKPLSNNPRRLRFSIVHMFGACFFSFICGTIFFSLFSNPTPETKMPIQPKTSMPVKVAQANKPKKTPPVYKKPVRKPIDWRERESKSMAYIMMKDFVKKRLKSPKTADFPGVWDGRGDHVTYLGNQRYKIVSYVDAQNSFGALIRNDFVGIVEQTSEDRWSLNEFSFMQR